MPLSPLRMQLMSERLRLRPWRDEDRDPFAALNADPVVMEHFPATLTREQSDALIDRTERCFAENGWGLWATERRDTGEFIGFIGLNPIPAVMPPAPAVEIGWRLAAAHWNLGFATEGARVALSFGFRQAGLDEVIAYTSRHNLRSRHVMDKIGLVHDPARDFMDPRVPGAVESAVLYALSRPDA